MGVFKYYVSRFSLILDRPPLRHHCQRMPDPLPKFKNSSHNSSPWQGAFSTIIIIIRKMSLLWGQTICLSPPPHLCVRNVCPRGTNNLFVPRGQTKVWERDRQTNRQTQRFIYTDLPNDQNMLFYYHKEYILGRWSCTHDSGRNSLVYWWFQVFYSNPCSLFQVPHFLSKCQHVSILA